MIDITPAFTVLTPNMRPASRAEWVAALTPAMQSGGIINAKRAAIFLAQCSVESGNFQHLAEDFWYLTPDRIHQTFPSHFPTVESAKPFVGEPEALANEVYHAKLGNLLEDDGWRFRGRGLLQITGRTTYHDCWQSIAPDVDFERTFPDLLMTPKYAALSAVWFWNWAHHDAANGMADGWQITNITRMINGPALLGLAERIAASNIALKALVPVPMPAVVANNPETTKGA